MEKDIIEFHNTLIRIFLEYLKSFFDSFVSAADKVVEACADHMPMRGLPSVAITCSHVLIIKSISDSKW